MKLRRIFLMGMMVCGLSVQAQKYVGGDISMLPQYEKAGVVYKDAAGNTVSDVLAFFKQEASVFSSIPQKTTTRPYARISTMSRIWASASRRQG